jgi:hypothetical protein
MRNKKRKTGNTSTFGTKVHSITTNGSNKVFHSYLNSEDSTAYLQFHTEFNGAAAGTRYEFTNETGGSAKYTFVSYTAESGSTKAKAELTPEVGHTNRFSGHSAGDEYRFYVDEEILSTEDPEGKLDVKLLKPPTGSLDGRHSLTIGPEGGIEWKEQGPQDNAKTPTSPGQRGERVVGQIGPSWYLFVCYAPNKWGRVPLELTW